ARFYRGLCVAQAITPARAAGLPAPHKKTAGMSHAPSMSMEYAENLNNVSNPERWFSVVAGTALAAYGLTRRSVPGLLLAGVGGVLAWRGATGHCMIYESLGISSADFDDDRQVSVPYGRGIRVEKSVTVNSSPEKLYRFWRNFENLPRFMSHLKDVKVLDDKRSHWVAKGPAGK